MIVGGPKGPWRLPPPHGHALRMLCDGTAESRMKEHIQADPTVSGVRFSFALPKLNPQVTAETAALHLHSKRRATWLWQIKKC